LSGKTTSFFEVLDVLAGNEAFSLVPGVPLPIEEEEEEEEEPRRWEGTAEAGARPVGREEEPDEDPVRRSEGRPGN